MLWLLLLFKLYFSTFQIYKWCAAKLDRSNSYHGPSWIWPKFSYLKNIENFPEKFPFLTFYFHVEFFFTILISIFFSLPCTGIENLVLGVGMDDAFVLLAAWRRTNPTMSVPKRLSYTYAEAAVSITITSLTNFISFMIGIITPFPSVSFYWISIFPVFNCPFPKPTRIYSFHY